MANTPRNAKSTSSFRRDGTKTFLKHGSSQGNRHLSSPSTPVKISVQGQLLPCLGVPSNRSSPRDHLSRPTAITPVCTTSQAEMYHSPSNISPSAPVPTFHHQSRLPPNTVARKAPRKATVITTRSIPGATKTAKPRSRNTKSPHSVNAPKQTASRTIAHKSVKEATPPPERVPSPAGSLRALTPEDRKRKVTGNESLTFSANVQSTDETGTASAAAASHTPTQPSNPASRDQRHQHPQSRFEYSLTPQLKSIKRAFGPDSWTEYVVLVEKHELAEITDREYQVQERRLFQVPSAKMRKLIKKLVVEQMVDPEATD